MTNASTAAAALTTCGSIGAQCMMSECNDPVLNDHLDSISAVSDFTQASGSLSLRLLAPGPAPLSYSTPRLVELHLLQIYIPIYAVF